MNRTVFSKKVQQYITNEMSLCLDDLTTKILKDVLDSSKFFNDLFEYMIDLNVPYVYDTNNLSKGTD